MMIIDSNGLPFEMLTSQSITSLHLPNNLFSSISNVTNNTGITHAVFVSDSLFLRRENNDMEVGVVSSYQQVLWDLIQLMD